MHLHLKILQEIESPKSKTVCYLCRNFGVETFGKLQCPFSNILPAVDMKPEFLKKLNAQYDRKKVQKLDSKKAVLSFRYIVFCLFHYALMIDL